MESTTAKIDTDAGEQAAGVLPVTLTDAALDHVRRHLDHSDGVVGLRFGTRRTGCSGWAYVIDFAQAIEDDDRVFEGQGVKVVVDPKSLSMVAGTEIDFVNDGLNHVFRFRNPNVKGECGCGESFTIDEPGS